MKSAVGVRADAMAVVEYVGHLVDRFLHRIGARGLHEDRIDETGEARRDAVRIRQCRIKRVFGGCQRRRGDADDFALAGRKRNHHDVVLILPHAGLPLAFVEPDHAQRNAFHQHDRADRVVPFGKQLAIHGLAEHDHQRGAGDVVVGQATALFDAPVRNRRITRGDGLNAGRPVLVAELHLTRLADHVADLRDRRAPRAGSRPRPQPSTSTRCRSRRARRPATMPPAPRRTCSCRGFRAVFCTASFAP